jgi:hypothetical protein
MARQICIKNSPSHSFRDTAALNTAFGMEQEKVPDTFLLHQRFRFSSQWDSKGSHNSYLNQEGTDESP